MGIINSHIPDDVDDKFRKAIAIKFGLKQGALKKALIEAIKEWTERNKSD